MDLENRVEEYIRKNHLIRKEDQVCVALSGGADSVTLLLVLQDLGIRVSAVHVNHQLRGEESDGDESFVRRLCDERKVPLYVFSSDVRELAHETKTGIEEAGRMARHRAFYDCVSRHGAAAIAVAHHANDLAETFIFHAARGSSLKGLSGIRPVQEITLRPGRSMRQNGLLCERRNDFPAIAGSFREIRPLLCVTRKEIEAFLTERGQDYRTDSTNFITDGSRNRIRWEVIPYFEREINAETVRHISEAAGDIAAADDFLRQEAEKRAADIVCVCGDGTVMLRDRLADEPEIIQGYILLDALARMSGSAKDIGRTQVNQIRSLFDMQSGNCISLPYGLEAVRDYEGVTLLHADSRRGERSTDNCRGGKRSEESVRAGSRQENCAPVEITGSGVCFWNGWQFTCDVLPAQSVDSACLKDGQSTPSGDAAEYLRGPAGGGLKRNLKYTKFLNYDKIKQNLCIRKRFSGDRIHTGPGDPDGPGKKLSDYMIDEKIPARRRDDIPLLASGHTVYWVVGHRISTESRVTSETSQILRICAERITEGE